MFIENPMSSNFLFTYLYFAFSLKIYLGPFSVIFRLGQKHYGEKYIYNSSFHSIFIV